jgi:hypothetical protein
VSVVPTIPLPGERFVRVGPKTVKGTLLLGLPPTVTTTLYNLATPNSPNQFIPNMFVMGGFLLLPAMLFGALTKQFWGALLGLSLGLAITVAIGAIPFYV